MMLLPLMLIATPTAPALPQPAASVVHGDLALAERADRAKLRSRVSDAVRGFCAANAGEVTPHVFRHDKFYCLERARNAVVADMPRDVRGAYRLALKEAGITGRRL